ncbi:MAG TPA: hypothetical protein VK357_03610 [Rubrobacteraceae bacterium]|nr:hypothetical protein [Rubrobacteraceae bacterium]
MQRLISEFDWGPVEASAFALLSLFRGARAGLLAAGVLAPYTNGYVSRELPWSNERSMVSKRDYVMFAVLAVLGAAAFSAIGVLTVLEGPEWVKFVIAMVFFVTVLIGSYLYVIGPQKGDSERNTDD